ncbi:MAG TPA: TIM-barrel domain-containing protein [bacterium]|nr:TIM-barrel domain-containing protein [bacterium]
MGKRSVLLLALGLVVLAAWSLDERLPGVEFSADAARVEVAVAPFAVTAGGDARIEPIDAGRVRLTSRSGQLAIKLEPGEAIYGLTERIVDDPADSESDPKAVGGLDRRGEIVTMWVRPTIAGYAPFYISSRGYGMYVEGTDPGIYDIGKTDPDSLRLAWYNPDGFSCVFIFGPSYEQVLDRYTAMAGRPFLPPRWAFLPLKWRDEVMPLKFAKLDGVTMNAEVVDDVVNYEKLGLPAGIYMIDRPWAEGKMGYGNFTWDPKRFPNGDKMVEVLHQRGWRVMVWGAPWAIGKKPSDFGPEARQKGLLIGDRCLDYTNPEAVAWHADKIKAFVARSGVDGWKLDRSEEYNPSKETDLWHDGRNGVRVHNEYPLLYVKTYYEATRAVRGDDFVLMPRAAYAGSQKYCIVWGGDTRGSVERMGVRGSTDLGLRSVIISLQRMACMGFPVWGSDTGGYQTFRDREVFARWLEFSAFCPLMEIGGVDSHEPWNMPTRPAYDDEMIKIFRRYTWLHARLADYSLALAQRAHDTGNPIVHPLVFDWPDDPQVKNLWHEYMYGPALLVAPVWESGRREREVYLPAGQWQSLWDPSQHFTGPATVTAPAPLDRIPVFIRAGAEQMPPPGLAQGL